ncbi:hypothetical protein ANN_02600 [Periplaneta americana]|uniref:Uncharacterized protein n=1 Tax=Periplaneta americana TaxID=6978 RepID=A0ABQ8TZ96_PERAM|nr:hypothetical protein ANN_02600 [Periplaneta americana]
MTTTDSISEQPKSKKETEIIMLPSNLLRENLGETSTSAYKNSIKHTTMRVLLFQIIAPGIPLPPQPVLTRWETWLDSVNYYAEHYGKIMEVIDVLDSKDSSAVAAVKSAF